MRGVFFGRIQSIYLYIWVLNMVQEVVSRLIYVEL